MDGAARPSGGLRAEGKTSCQQEGPSPIRDVTAAADDQGAPKGTQAGGGSWE